MTKLAIFDCDGTLIDGQASICEAMEAAFAAQGLPLPERNEVRRAVGLSLPQAIARLSPQSDAQTCLAVTEAYKQAFRAARAEGRLSQPLIEGIPQALDTLRAAGWRLGVATGMSDRGLAHCLEAHGIADRFVTLQTADRHPSKPHPSMIRAALLEGAAEAAEAVMIGDTAFDMEMAKSAGVRALGVEWGYHAPAELRAAGAEFVSATPAALSEYLLHG